MTRPASTPSPVSTARPTTGSASTGPSSIGNARAFTGRHMAIIMVSFFGIVIAVNLVMARFAVSTFGGTVVDNSYVASQKFNGWLADAEAQERDGWTQKIALDDERHLTLHLARQTAAITDPKLTITAKHPLGLAPSLTLDMVSLGDGQWQSLTTLPQGRWLIHVTAQDGDHIAQFQGEVR